MPFKAGFSLGEFAHVIISLLDFFKSSALYHLIILLNQVMVPNQCENSAIYHVRIDNRFCYFRFIWFKIISWKVV